MNIVLVLVAFCIMFWKHHNLTRQVTTNSLKSLPINSHADLIDTLDTSPFNISVSFFGSDYSQCDNFYLSISGCETTTGVCKSNFDVCHYPEQDCKIIGNSGEPLNVSELGVKSFCKITKVVKQVYFSRKLNT